VGRVPLPGRRDLRALLANSLGLLRVVNSHVLMVIGGIGGGVFLFGVYGVLDTPA
jgi:hypothetical protein